METTPDCAVVVSTLGWNFRMVGIIGSKCHRFTSLGKHYSYTSLERCCVAYTHIVKELTFYNILKKYHVFVFMSSKWNFCCNYYLICDVSRYNYVIICGCTEKWAKWGESVPPQSPAPSFGRELASRRRFGTDNSGHSPYLEFEYWKSSMNE